jgi:hypothetical protein
MHDRMFRRFGAQLLVAIALASWWGCGGSVQPDRAAETAANASELTIVATEQGAVRGFRGHDRLPWDSLRIAAGRASSVEAARARGAPQGNP